MSPSEHPHYAKLEFSMFLNPFLKNEHSEQPLKKYWYIQEATQELDILVSPNRAYAHVQ